MLIGIIALLLLLFGWPILGWVLGQFEEKVDKDGFGCGMTSIILTIAITIIGFIGMMKSCADNDHGPTRDYYDAPRK